MDGVEYMSDFFKYILLRASSTSIAELESEILPYLFKSNGRTLRNYRIYGNTINHTNLFAGVEFTNNAYISANGSEMSSGGTLALKHSDFISISENTSYTLKFTAITLQTPNSNTISFCFFDENKEILSYRPTKNVSSGDTVEWSNISPENAKYLIINTVSASDTLNLYATYESTGVGDYDSTTGKYVIPVVIGGKNILKNTKGSVTYTNMTSVVDSEGKITINGYVSGTTFIDINANLTLPDVSGMVFSGCPENGSASTYCQRATLLSNDNYVNQTGTEKVFQNGGDAYKVNIRINANYVCDNLVFKPMIRYPNTDSTFEPYHEPKVYNICLDEPLKANEYIDFREQKCYRSDNTREIVSLPAVTCIDGTNVLSVNTGIQPASVYLQGSIEEIRATSLQTLNLNSRNSEIMNFDDVSLDVMPIEKSVNLNEVGGGKSAE